MSFECQPHCRRSSAPQAAFGLQGSGVFRLTSFRHLSGEAGHFPPCNHASSAGTGQHHNTDDPRREETIEAFKFVDFQLRLRIPYVYPAALPS